MSWANCARLVSAYLSLALYPSPPRLQAWSVKSVDALPGELGPTSQHHQSRFLEHTHLCWHCCYAHLSAVLEPLAICYGSSAS